MLFVLLLASCDENRIWHIQRTLVDEQKKLTAWSFAWGGIYSAATTTQAVVSRFVDAETRKDLTVGAAAAALGTLTLTLFPLRVTVPIWKVNWNDPDRCAVLAQAEAVFVEAAHAQAQATSWIGHVGNVVLNTAIILFIGFAFGHWQNALISGGIGIAVGELNLLTQPAHLPKALEQYRAIW